eukprot:1160153-Pelagomonas_calceolata.AAC.4
MNPDVPLELGFNKFKLCTHVFHRGATHIRQHFLEVPGSRVANCAVENKRRGGLMAKMPSQMHALTKHLQDMGLLVVPGSHGRRKSGTAAKQQQQQREQPEREERGECALKYLERPAQATLNWACSPHRLICPLAKGVDTLIPLEKGQQQKKHEEAGNRLVAFMKCGAIR